jgi:hypothetical protein
MMEAERTVVHLRRQHLPDCHRAAHRQHPQREQPAVQRQRRGRRGGCILMRQAIWAVAADRGLGRGAASTELHAARCVIIGVS